MSWLRQLLMGKEARSAQGVADYGLSQLKNTEEVVGALSEQAGFWSADKVQKWQDGLDSLEAGFLTLDSTVGMSADQVKDARERILALRQKLSQLELSPTPHEDEEGGL